MLRRRSAFTILSILAGMSCMTMRLRADDTASEGAVTFTKDIAPIFQKNCQVCHRPGGDNYTGMVAPMSLVSYDDVRPWVKSIVKEVRMQRMPPWKASEEFHGVFQNERSLTAGERQTIEKWALTGAAKGRDEDAPTPITFPDFGGWRIGNPDLIVKFEKPFHVADAVSDQYTNVSVALTDEILPESRWIKAIEWKGGSPSVHHIVGFALIPGQATGEMGGGYGLGSIAPGEEPMIFPDGYAKLLVKGSRLIFSMHYHKEAGAGTAVDDVSMVAFRFYPKDAKIEHFVEHNMISNHTFELPPGAPRWKIGAAKTFARDTTILALHPHMHLRGKDAKYIAYYPDGTNELLLKVPAWDFNWQTDYSYKESKKVPAGTRVEYSATFDNSAGNPANPDPKVAVPPGQKTTDEMMIGFITYADTDKQEVTMEHAMGLLKKTRFGEAE